MLPGSWGGSFLGLGPAVAVGELARERRSPQLEDLLEDPEPCEDTDHPGSAEEVRRQGRTRKSRTIDEQHRESRITEQGSERRAADARSDDDHVVAVTHGISLPHRRQHAQPRPPTGCGTPFRPERAVVIVGRAISRFPRTPRTDDERRDDERIARAPAAPAWAQRRDAADVAAAVGNRAFTALVAREADTGASAPGRISLRPHPELDPAHAGLGGGRRDGARPTRDRVVAERAGRRRPPRDDPRAPAARRAGGRERHGARAGGAACRPAPRRLPCSPMRCAPRRRGCWPRRSRASRPPASTACSAATGR